MTPQSRTKVRGHTRGYYGRRIGRDGYLWHGILFDDTTVDDNRHRWSQICEEHRQQYKIASRHIDEGAGDGICGVKGCDNEADHYIDFGK